jgi:heterodisulfide reductase subunit A
MNQKIGKALVVGAGISGIRAALDLAEYGYGVTLIDRSPHAGGILSQLDYQFPTDRCGMCKMLPLIDRDAGSQHCLRRGLFHENIDLLLGTELVSVDGEPGHFQVELREHPNWINADLCTGCGECTTVCPVEVPDDFNSGLAKRKAIYLPVPHAIPNAYRIDYTACSHCGACMEACPTGAIQLPEQQREGFRILVVDDELVVRDSLKEWLEEEGFSVDMAASGAEALEQLADQSYQLMLLDIKMPGMDGVTVLQKAMESHPDIAVIMMTAYATVETAVEAMKIGALDYLLKPFDPETLIPTVLQRYQEQEAARNRQLEVGSVVICGGTRLFDPTEGKDVFGYADEANVVTSIEFERMLSGCGPCQGTPLRPRDGKPIRKIAWLQCIGSRDLQTDSDFCSSICCMAAVKEAVLSREKIGGDLETVIFYMDMRTFGQSFQRYRDQAESVHGVRFERSRVHSITRNIDSGELVLRFVNTAGAVCEENFDLVVLSVGQRPAAGFSSLMASLDLAVNPWGFCDLKPFSLTRTQREGIFIGGSFGGLKDIGDSVVQASAAASAASRVIHAGGGSLALEAKPAPPRPSTDREVPRILAAVCTCGERFSDWVDPPGLSRQLALNPLVGQVAFIERACTRAGWEQLAELVAEHHPNRLLIGACLPCAHQRQLPELARAVGLDRAGLKVVDLGFPSAGHPAHSSPESALRALQTGIAELKWTGSVPMPAATIEQRALVVGGGIAGMSAALAMAEHGFEVDLVEQSEQLGGNLAWLRQTLEGHDIQAMLADRRAAVQKHPLIRPHTQTRVIYSAGEVGNFHTSIENEAGEAQVLHHGVSILATGGTEASTSSFGYGSHPAIITQKELEQKLAAGDIDAPQLDAVVMIQCVDSREEPRNYCSRVCCATSLKHALELKESHPELAVYILYRDMMAYGFAESYFTRARSAGVTFIRYSLDQKPAVEAGPSELKVLAREPILGRPIEIEADLVILATGVIPNLPRDLAESFGAGLDRDGFFQEAESKWRPVDSLKEGVFACGLSHSPRNITETIATAEAAAERALRILSRERVQAGSVVATVHHSLCSLCERCIDACPYGARALDADNEQVAVNPVMCQGCGACAAVCPNSASTLEGFNDQQMLEVIDAAIG